MKQVYFVLFISVFAITSAFAGIPDDKDLLMWIGEGSGKKAPDGTGNGNDGTLHGNAKWVADGKYQAGISLKGAETYLEVPDVITMAGSLLFWFKPDWDGKDGEDYRIFDAQVSVLYTFLSPKGLITLTLIRKTSVSILKPLMMLIGRMSNSTQQGL